METENLNPSYKKSSDSEKVTVFEPQIPIAEQKDAQWEIAANLVAKWIELERIVVKAADISGREDSEEEVKLMLDMMRKYATFTPREIGNAMRKAADDCQAEYASQRRLFPRMYLADIEHEIQKMGMELLKKKPQPMALEANTGGNAFFGEPSEALLREWPKIVAQTLKIRQSWGNEKIRDRFWYGGSLAQQESAKKMLAQMVHEIREAGQWDQNRFNQAALEIFKVEYWTGYPDWRGMTDDMQCPMVAADIADLKTRTLEKISNRIRAKLLAPSIDVFPDPQDCTFSAIFDAYWKFWESQDRA